MYKPENNNGRWELVEVVDTPEKWAENIIDGHPYRHLHRTRKIYSILPEHAPIFQSMEKIGDGDFEVVEMPIEKDDLLPEHCQPKVARTKPHAIPKAKNEDVWEEVEKQVGGLKVSPNTRYVIRCLVQLWRDNYNLTRKK